MRVLIVVPALAALYGGPSRIAEEFASALGRLGLAVDVVTTNAAGPDNTSQPLNEWIGGDHYRLRVFPRSGRSEYKLSGSLAVWLMRNVRAYDLVQIISLFNFPVLAAALACRIRHVPYIVNPQGMLEPWALAYKSWKKRAYYRSVEKPIVLHGARAIQALTANEAANIEALKSGPLVFVLPNGINLESAAEETATELANQFLGHFPAARDRRLILFLHRIDPKKGLDLLAQAFGLIRLRFPDAVVVVAGPDNIGYSTQTEHFFATAGCYDALLFTGMLEGALKRGAFAAASVFVAPSYSEGFSMSILEAMAAGLPCVITTRCNFPQAGQAGAARVVAPVAEKFAEALDAVLQDPVSSRAMGERAREFVKEYYTWDKIATDFHSNAESLLKS